MQKIADKTIIPESAFPILLQSHHYLTDLLGRRTKWINLPKGEVQNHRGKERKVCWTRDEEEILIKV